MNASRFEEANGKQSQTLILDMKRQQVTAHLQ